MCSPLIIFQWKRKMRKIQIIFDIEHWLWKSNFGTFWHLPVNPILNPKLINFLWVFWFLGKIFLILYPPLKNFTIHIAIDLYNKNFYDNKMKARNMVWNLFTFYQATNLMWVFIILANLDTLIWTRLLWIKFVMANWNGIDYTKTMM